MGNRLALKQSRELSLRDEVRIATQRRRNLRVGGEPQSRVRPWSQREARTPERSTKLLECQGVRNGKGLRWRPFTRLLGSKNDRQIVDRREICRDAVQE